MKNIKLILLKTIILVALLFVTLSTIIWSWYLTRTDTQVVPIGYVNIKELGAKGDGVTDDAPIIQLAENTGKSIYFPKGTYRICSNLVKRNKVNWLGGGYDSIILINGDPYSYGSTNIIRNESYGTVDTSLGRREKWDYGYKNTGQLDGFEFKDLTIKFRSALKGGEQPESGYIHVFNFTHTNRVNITNVFMDSDANTNRGNCIFVFRGGNYNTTIENCKMIYDTNPYVLYGGSVVFASRSTSNPIQKIIIRDNTITKKNGGDEVLWFGANFNAINDVLIENNTIQAVSSGVTKASIIMFAQASDEMLSSVSEPWNKVVIENNNIVTNNINFSTIFVGYDFGTNSRKGGTVTISNNLINTTKSASSEETVSGILVGRAKIVTIHNNTIVGTQDEGVTAEVDVGIVSNSANRITMK